MISPDLWIFWTFSEASTSCPDKRSWLSTRCVRYHRTRPYRKRAPPLWCRSPDHRSLFRRDVAAVAKTWPRATSAWGCRSLARGFVAVGSLLARVPSSTFLSLEIRPLHVEVARETAAGQLPIKRIKNVKIANNQTSILIKNKLLDYFASDKS